MSVFSEQRPSQQRKQDADARTPLTAGFLLDDDSLSSDGWGSLDDDREYVDSPKKERRRRSASVPKYAGDTLGVLKETSSARSRSSKATTSLGSNNHKPGESTAPRTTGLSAIEIADRPMDWVPTMIPKRSE